MSDAALIALFQALPQFAMALGALIAAIMAAIASFRMGRTVKAVDAKTDRIETKAEAAVESAQKGETQNVEILKKVDGNYSELRRQLDAAMVALNAKTAQADQLQTLATDLIDAIKKVAPATVVVAPPAREVGATLSAGIEGRRSTDAIRTVTAPKPDEPKG